MMTLLTKAVSLQSWRKYLRSRCELVRRNRNEDAFNRFMIEKGPVRLKHGEKTIIGEGMWHNPNHYFRLRLFVEALAERGEFSLLGVLRTSNAWRERRALERIGFKEFIFLEEDYEFRTEQFSDQANDILEGVRDHRDLLALRLPAALPAYTLYDTVLKLARHPRPPLDSSLWRVALAELLRDVAIYQRELSRRQVSHVAVSHPWKNEWATLVWLALSRKVPSYYLTSYCDSIRIRRFVTQHDYAQPKDFLSRAEFDALTPKARAFLSSIGEQDLKRRAAANSTDINTRFAFNPAFRISDRAAARIALSGQDERPIGVVYCHSWVDFPHIFGLRNFTDYADWIRATVSRIGEIRDVIWLLKPHPAERWQGGMTLREIVGDLPPHVRVVTSKTDLATALNAADAVVTVHGTIGLEASAQGVPAILADRSYYSDWNIGYEARDRRDYFRLLGEVGRLPRPDAAARRRAMACFAAALAIPPIEVEALPMRTDADGSRLYDEIRDLYANQPERIAKEVARFGEFIDQNDMHSYAAYYLIKAAALDGVKVKAIAS